MSYAAAAAKGPKQSEEEVSLFTIHIHNRPTQRHRDIQYPILLLLIIVFSLPRVSKEAQYQLREQKSSGKTVAYF